MDFGQKISSHSSTQVMKMETFPDWSKNSKVK